MDVLSSISFGQRKALLYNRAFQGCRDFELLSVNKQGVPTGVCHPIRDGRVVLFQ